MPKPRHSLTRCAQVASNAVRHAPTAPGLQMTFNVKTQTWEGTNHAYPVGCPNVMLRMAIPFNLPTIGLCELW